MTRRRRHNLAFTLPEVLASLVLVGLVLPAVMKCISLSLSASDDARKRTEAVGLAETKLAELAASATSTSAGTTAGDFGPERPAFRWDASTITTENSLSEIRVRVTWHGRQAERSIDLSTFAYVGSGASGTLGTTSSASGGTP
jgi:Tfp pilus assembly protein PilV